MKILLFGSHGQVGWEAQRTLAPLGDVLALDKPELDLADTASLSRLLLEQKPDVIVNASAYTAVDRAEQEPELARAINAVAPGLMAEAARKVNAALIHFSTDYIFDGRQTRPYVETDTPRPLNVYGQSKLAGELAVQQAGGSYLILRTSWVYSLRGDSFVTKVLAWARRNDRLRIVDDQVSGPTWARMLAEAVALLVAQSRPSPGDYFREHQGIYHLAGSGYASRYDWAGAILADDPQREAQTVQVLEPARTDEFPAPAQRPLFSALDCSRFEAAFGLRLPDWKQALHMALKEAGK